MTTLAEKIYVAWCEANKGAGPDGAALPSWALMPDSERSKWAMAVKIEMERRRGQQKLHQFRAKVAKMGPRAAAILNPILDELPAVAPKGRLAGLWWNARAVWAACRAVWSAERATSTPGSAS